MASIANHDADKEEGEVNLQLDIMPRLDLIVCKWTSIRASQQTRRVTIPLNAWTLLFS